MSRNASTAEVRMCVMQGYEHYEKKKREHEMQGLPPPPMPTRGAAVSLSHCAQSSCSEIMSIPVSAPQSLKFAVR